MDNEQVTDDEQDSGPTNEAARNRLLAAAGEKVSGYGRQVGAQALRELDARREKAAEVIESVAADISKDADQRNGVSRYVRQRTAGGVASTGFFLHEHSVGELSSIGQTIRQHRFLAIILALLLGYLIGRFLATKRPNDRSEDAA